MRALYILINLCEKSIRMTTPLDNTDYVMVREAMDMISELNLVDFVKNFNEKCGFISSPDNRVNLIGFALAHQSHSGASFAAVMRNCQYYFNHIDEWRQLKIMYELEPEPDPEIENTDNDLFFENSS